MTLIYMKLNPKLIALVSYMEGKFSQASVMWVFSGKYMCPTSILCMGASIFFAPICYIQLLFWEPVLKQDENQPAYTYAIHMPGFMV